MAEEQNDSPAFRLRPRRAEPKSYYTVRLEYSANPAAFTRERPRLCTAKRKAPTQRSPTSSYSRAKQTKTGNYNYGHLVQATVPPQAPKQNVVTKQDLEREERRKRLQREIAESITTDTMISPFMQRLELNELDPDSVYEQNYITLRIKSVEQTNDKKHLVCRCHTTSSDPQSARLYVHVHLYDEYARDSLLESEKIINIGKFKTGSRKAIIKSEDDNKSAIEDDGHDRDGGGSGGSGGGGGGGGASGDVIGDNSSEISKYDWIGFDVIVKYDERLKTSASCPLIPFVSITDMIEKPTEPFVEMGPPSPQPTAQTNVPKALQATNTTKSPIESSDTNQHILTDDNDNIVDDEEDDEEEDDVDEDPDEDEDYDDDDDDLDRTGESDIAE